jgi:hypothetical protein
VRTASNGFVHMAVKVHTVANACMQHKQSVIQVLCSVRKRQRFTSVVLAT